MKKLLLASLIVLLGCTANPSVLQETQTPHTPPTQTNPPEPEPQTSVKIISYNILFGGGILPEWYENIDKRFHRDRTPELLAYFKSLDPDIIVLQEAWGWNEPGNSMTAHFAEQLGLPNYYVASVPEYANIAILTRYEILEVESLYGHLGFEDIIRARLQTPDGNPLNLFALHLHPFDDEIRTCELSRIVEELEPYRHERTLLLGDLNFQINLVDGRVAPETLFMQGAGLDLILRDSTLNRDHLWIPETAAPWKIRSWFELPDGANNLSDHMPIGALFDFYAYDASTSGNNAADAGYLFPDFLIRDIGSPHVIAQIGFEDSCDNRRWFPDEVKTRFANDTYIMPSNGDEWGWVNFPGLINPGEGVLFQFKARPDSEFYFFLEDGEWDTDNFREVGFYFNEQLAQPYQWVGKEYLWVPLSESVTIEPQEYYWLSIVFNHDGNIFGYLQSEKAVFPALSFEFQTGKNENPRDWALRIASVRGVVTLDEFIRFSFPPNQ